MKQPSTTGRHTHMDFYKNNSNMGDIEDVEMFDMTRTK